MKKFAVTLTFLIASASAAALAVLPGAADASPSGTSSAQPASMQAGLCGMTQTKVLGIRDHYDLDLDLSVVADALQTPFNCSAHGDLCDLLNPVDARNYVCGVWNALDQRRPMADIIQTSHEALVEGDKCTPDAAACADACFATGVSSCNGLYYLGSCQSFALCNGGWVGDIRGLGEVLTSG